MNSPESSEHPKGLRADAQRNREKLVAAAKAVFTKYGGDASMEAIAKEAGVGAGTLYRHFPKRIDIVEAVYRTDVDELALTAEKAAANEEPFQALDTYLHAFLKYAAGKRVFLNELHDAFERNPQLRLDSRERMNSSINMLLRRAQEAGVVRTDVDGADVMQLIQPTCIGAGMSDEQRERLMAVVIDGLRT